MFSLYNVVAFAYIITKLFGSNSKSLSQVFSASVYLVSSNWAENLIANALKLFLSGHIMKYHF